MDSRAQEEVFPLQLLLEAEQEQRYVVAAADGASAVAVDPDPSPLAACAMSGAAAMNVPFHYGNFVTTMLRYARAHETSQGSYPVFDVRCFALALMHPAASVIVRQLIEIIVGRDPMLGPKKKLPATEDEDPDEEAAMEAKRAAAVDPDVLSQLELNLGMQFRRTHTYKLPMRVRKAHVLDDDEEEVRGPADGRPRREPPKSTRAAELKKLVAAGKVAKLRRGAASPMAQRSWARAGESPPPAGGETTAGGEFETKNVAFRTTTEWDMVAQVRATHDGLRSLLSLALKKRGVVLKTGVLLRSLFTQFINSTHMAHIVSLFELAVRSELSPLPPTDKTGKDSLRKPRSTAISAQSPRRSQSETRSPTRVESAPPADATTTSDSPTQRRARPKMCDGVTQTAPLVTKVRIVKLDAQHNKVSQQTVERRQANDAAAGAETDQQQAAAPADDPKETAAAEDKGDTTATDNPADQEAAAPANNDDSNTAAATGDASTEPAKDSMQPAEDTDSDDGEFSVADDADKPADEAPPADNAAAKDTTAPEQAAADPAPAEDAAAPADDAPRDDAAPPSSETKAAPAASSKDDQPQDTAATAAPKPLPRSEFVARVRRVFRWYDPDKLDTADSLVAKYEGREEAVVAALGKKYGPEPTDEQLEFRRRLDAMYDAYSIGTRAHGTALLRKYAGKEEALIRALVKKHGPEPAAADDAPADTQQPAADDQAQAQPAADSEAPPAAAATEPATRDEAPVCDEPSDATMPPSADDAALVLQRLERQRQARVAAEARADRRRRNAAATRIQSLHRQRAAKKEVAERRAAADSKAAKATSSVGSSGKSSPRYVDRTPSDNGLTPSDRSAAATPRNAEPAATTTDAEQQQQQQPKQQQQPAAAASHSDARTEERPASRPPLKHDDSFAEQVAAVEREMAHETRQTRSRQQQLRQQQQPLTMVELERDEQTPVKHARHEQPSQSPAPHQQQHNHQAHHRGPKPIAAQSSDVAPELRPLLYELAVKYQQREGGDVARANAQHIQRREVQRQRNAHKPQRAAGAPYGGDIEVALGFRKTRAQRVRAEAAQMRQADDAYFRRAQPAKTLAPIGQRPAYAVTPDPPPPGELLLQQQQRTKFGANSVPPARLSPIRTKPAAASHSPAKARPTPYHALSKNDQKKVVSAVAASVVASEKPAPSPYPHERRAPKGGHNAKNAAAARRAQEEREFDAFVLEQERHLQFELQQRERREAEERRRRNGDQDDAVPA